jgi:hypothetical protein
VRRSHWKHRCVLAPKNSRVRNISDLRKPKLRLPKQLACASLVRAKELYSYGSISKERSSARGSVFSST